MSLKQNQIISRLLALASESQQATRVAAAICRGSKIISISVNNHRNKYGDEIRCAGHAEIAAIYNLVLGFSPFVSLCLLVCANF